MYQAFWFIYLFIYFGRYYDMWVHFLNTTTSLLISNQKKEDNFEITTQLTDNPNFSNWNFDLRLWWNIFATKNTYICSLLKVVKINFHNNGRICCCRTCLSLIAKNQTADSSDLEVKTLIRSIPPLQLNIAANLSGKFSHDMGCHYKKQCTCTVCLKNKATFDLNHEICSVIYWTIHW